MRIGALEAGGTKMVCAVGDETGAVYARTQFPTAGPEETIGTMLEWFRKQKVEALGIGCFGPIDLRRTSETYGRYHHHAKTGMGLGDMAGAFRRGLGVPVGFIRMAMHLCWAK